MNRTEAARQRYDDVNRREQKQYDEHAETVRSAFPDCAYHITLRMYRDPRGMEDYRGIRQYDDGTVCLDHRGNPSWPIFESAGHAELFLRTYGYRTKEEWKALFTESNNADHQEESKMKNLFIAQCEKSGDLFDISLRDTFAEAKSDCLDDMDHMTDRERSRCKWTVSGYSVPAEVCTLAEFTDWIVNAGCQDPFRAEDILPEITGGREDLFGSLLEDGIEVFVEDGILVMADNAMRCEYEDTQENRTRCIEEAKQMIREWEADRAD